MSRAPGIIALLLLVTPLAAAPSAAPRQVGLVIDAPLVSNALPLVRFVDVMLDTMAGSRQWEPTIDRRRMTADDGGEPGRAVPPFL